VRGKCKVGMRRGEDGGEQRRGEVTCQLGWLHKVLAENDESVIADTLLSKGALLKNNLLREHRSLYSNSQ
jgi:hypothetical protein